MPALEHGDLLAQCENLETKVMACAKERTQVGEGCEHASVIKGLSRAERHSVTRALSRPRASRTPIAEGGGAAAASFRIRPCSSWTMA